VYKVPVSGKKERKESYFFMLYHIEIHIYLYNREGKREKREESGKVIYTRARITTE